MNEYIYVWADGTWCEWEDLEEYLSMMSDDYKTIPIDSEEAAAVMGV